jgi:hypothetical protein
MTLLIEGTRPSSNRPLVVAGIALFAAGPLSMSFLSSSRLLRNLPGLVGWLMVVWIFGGMSLLMIAYRPRKATLRVEESEEPSPTGAPFRAGPGVLVIPSWSTAIRPALEQVQLGAWIQPGVGASPGVFVEVVGEGGRVIVGAKGQGGRSHVLTATPRRSVELEVDVPDLDALLEALGVTPDAPRP